MKKWLLYLIFTLSFLVFVVFGSLALDPDFGWHIEEGHLILSSGFPKLDPFSYSMPSFKYVDHEWLSNVFMFLVYNGIGKIVLSTFFAAVAFLAFYVSISANRSKNKWGKTLQISLFVLLAGASAAFSGVRPQVISWLMFSFIALFIYRQDLWNKYKYLLPLGFLFWANLHGSFVVGIFLLLVFFVVRSIRTKKIIVIDFAIIILSALATLINPYKEGVWREFLMTAKDSSLRWRIAEWMPSIFTIDMCFLFILCLSVVLVIKHFKEIKAELLAVYLMSLVMAVSSLRNIPIFVILTVPLVAVLIDKFFAKISKSKVSQRRFVKAMNIFLLISIAFFLFDVSLNARPGLNLREEAYYPKKAVSYLKEHSYPGRLFSFYGWGGYLIWKLPQEKTFVDGRMPSWRNEAAGKEETASAMDDYIKITSGETSFQVPAEKYGIKTVLWPTGSKPSFSEQKIKELENTLRIKEKDFNLFKELESQGWKKVYSDAVATIYTRE